MKKKKIIKKCLALFLTVLAFAASMSVTSSAATITVPNNEVNAYDKYHITSGSEHYVNGYMTSALSSDIQFLGMTVAGKVSGSTKKSVTVGINSNTNATRNFKVITKNPSGSTISSLSYPSGTGTNTGSDSYVQRKASTIYYILVDVELKSTYSGTIYMAYPSITVQT